MGEVSKAKEITMGRGSSKAGSGGGGSGKITEKTLTDKGFKKWENKSKEIVRYYLNPQDAGVEFDYYKTGNISSAKIDGEQISNSEGYRIKNSKTYYDPKTNEILSTNKRMLEQAMKLLGSKKDFELSETERYFVAKYQKARK